MDARTANQIQMQSFASSPVVSFRCECGDVDCRRTVPLSPVSYREHRLRDEAVLYPGHASVEDEPLVAERERLAGDAASVRRGVSGLR